MSISTLAVTPEGLVVPYREKPLIAILDDFVFFQVLFSDILSDQGWNTVVYGHKDEFLAHLPLIMPDVILTDLISPRMDGLRFLEKIKQHERFRYIPVVIVTGCSGYAGKSKSMGAFAYIRKPCKVKKLVGVIRRAMG